MLQCGLSCASIEEIFDESTVKKYVKSDLGNASWLLVVDTTEYWDISLFHFWFSHRSLSIPKFLCFYKKNNYFFLWVLLASC